MLFYHSRKRPKISKMHFLPVIELVSDSLTAIKVEPHQCLLHQSIWLIQGKDVFFWVGNFDFDFFFQKNKKIASSPWKSVKVSLVARMGRNFNDYLGFQPKTPPAQRYVTQCTCPVFSLISNSIFQNLFIRSYLKTVFNYILLLF